MVKIGDSASFAEGDILNAFSDNRIRCVHAEHICARTPARKRRRDPESLSLQFETSVFQYRFQRVGPKAIERVDLQTGEKVVIDDTPRMIEGTLQQIDVAAYLVRRLSGDNHGIYGERGSEFWFGGPVDLSPANVNKVWDAIEARTPRRRTEAAVKLWPAGAQDLKSHLLLTLDADITEELAAELESPEVDNSKPDAPEILQRRRNGIRLGITTGFGPALLNRLRDRNVSVDLRVERGPFSLTALRVQKPSRRITR